MADLQKAFQKQGSGISPFADIITTNGVCISSGVEVNGVGEGDIHLIPRHKRATGQAALRHLFLKKKDVPIKLLSNYFSFSILLLLSPCLPVSLSPRLKIVHRFGLHSARPPFVRPSILLPSLVPFLRPMSLTLPSSLDSNLHCFLKVYNNQRLIRFII